MKRSLLLALGLLAAPSLVSAQLFGIPNYASPSAFGTPSTFLAATYGRGLNDASGKLDAYAAAIGRSGLGNRFTVVGGFGMVDAAESEWTFGGSVSADLLQPASATQVSVQGGVGYMGIDALGGTLTTLNFPIGVALKYNIPGPTATVTPWVMPRANIMRMSLGGNSSTETDFGASAGFGLTLPNGFGAHSAIDLLAADQNSWTVGVGIHYVMP
jgi:hypothetical protein